MDVNELKPGERWDQSISEALKASIGLLAFVSRSSLKSEWATFEYKAIAALRDRLLIPVILEDPGPDLPAALAMQQWVDLSGLHTNEQRDLQRSQPMKTRRNNLLS